MGQQHKDLPPTLRESTDHCVTTLAAVGSGGALSEASLARIVAAATAQQTPQIAAALQPAQHTGSRGAARGGTAVPTARKTLALA